MDWKNFTEKYVWNDNTTPYFVKVGELNKPQAKKEIFVYTFFISILFAFFAIASIADTKFQQDFLVLGKAIYPLSLFCGAVVLGRTKHVYAAIYCGTAPAAAALAILIGELLPDRGALDKIVMLAVAALWLRYAVRVVAIARAYPSMPEQSGA